MVGVSDDSDGGGPRTPSGSKTCSDYSWRLSLADLTQQATFSLLPGIDRAFTLASASPLTMTRGCGDSALRLGQTMEFKGEAPVAVDVSTEAPQLGLNLMTRRGVCTGSMRIERLNGPMVLDPATGMWRPSSSKGRLCFPTGGN